MGYPNPPTIDGLVPRVYRLEADVTALYVARERLSERIGQLETTLLISRGQRRVLLAAGGLIVTAGSFLGTVLGLVTRAV